MTRFEVPGRWESEGQVFLPPEMTEQEYKDALKFIPKSEDIMVVSYPNTGATMIEALIRNLKKHGATAKHDSEVTVEESTEPEHRDPDTCIHSTHLPAHLKQPVSDAKHVFVLRHPKSVAVSYFHHSSALFPDAESEKAFGKFMAEFSEGALWFGEYFQFYHQWLRTARNFRQDHFVAVYEKFLVNPMEELGKLAEFLGGILPDVVNNVEVVNAILKETLNDVTVDIVNSRMRGTQTIENQDCYSCIAYSDSNKSGIEQWKEVGRILADSTYRNSVLNTENLALLYAYERDSCTERSNIMSFFEDEDEGSFDWL